MLTFLCFLDAFHYFRKEVKPPLIQTGSIGLSNEDDSLFDQF